MQPVSRIRDKPLPRTSMDGLAHYDSALLSIYAAALDAARWREAWYAVTRYTGADSFHFFSLDLASATPNFGIVSDELPTQSLIDYDQYYGRIDPRRDIVAAMKPGELFVCHEHIDERFARRNEYYQDFLMPHDMRYAMGGSLARTESTDFFFALMRSGGKGHFTVEESQRMRRLVPHLQQAIGLFQQTSRLRELAGLGEAGLDLMETGVLATDAAGRVLYSNRLGEALLGRPGGLTLRQGVLTALQASLASRLSAALAVCASSGRPQSLRVSAEGGVEGEFLHLTIAHIHGPHALLNVHVSARLLVLVGRTNARRVLTGPQLMQLFGLTAAEARLARALAQGLTPEAYAEQQSLKMPTVRAQSRAVFAKTGVRRQSELVRILATIPVAR